MLINEVSTPELVNMMSGDQPPRLIDVRSAAEVMQGVLPNAEHIVMHTIPLRMPDLERDKPIVFYCRTGARSAQVCYFLKQQGFDNVINLRGGIVDWARNGQEIVSGADLLSQAI
ncbi:MAG: rhodanese-like domain-containing protein [Gammaproteobacteria bacterium]|nr:MAG: rhodanese-like domain-containing protein [Gammaproteobacteria bacterium]